MLYLKNLIRVLEKPITKNPFLFIFVFLLNFVSALSIIRTYSDISIIFFILLSTSFISYIENIIYIILPNILKQIYSYLLIGISICFLLFDWGCKFIFQSVINIDIIDIISETDFDEIKSFFFSYIGDFIIIAIPSILFILFIAYISKKLSSKKHSNHIILGLSLLGIFYVAYCSFNLIKYGSGMSMPQYTTPTRIAHALYISNKNSELNLTVLDKCISIEASHNIPEQDKLNIIVVIGESFSRYHSSLYGYKFNTNPLLKERKDSGELIVFDDVVSVSDHTHDVMESVFSLTKYGESFSSQPLFPSCFKVAGFQTSLYDNQYLIDKKKTFLNNKEISKTMFNKRNSSFTFYDNELIDSVTIIDQNSLTVVHLKGQHYQYYNKYPASFSQFSEENYDSKYSESQREIIAAYDNATLYNDYVLNNLIKKFESKNSILIYFTDHGEEVYECRDYIGHGNAAHSPNINYQIRIPFIIWMSDIYKLKYPDISQKIVNSHSTPIITDDIGHFLLDIATIKTKSFDSKRSFINDDYDKNKPRIVLRSIDMNMIPNNIGL